MASKTLIIFMVAYFSSIVILNFISVKIKLAQWISKEKKRKYIAQITTFVIYVSGYMAVESYIINENLKYMFIGILIAILMTPLSEPWIAKKRKSKKIFYL